MPTMTRLPTLSPTSTISPSTVAKRLVADTRIVLTYGSDSFGGSARSLSARGAGGNRGAAARPAVGAGVGESIVAGGGGDESAGGAGFGAAGSGSADPMLTRGACVRGSSIRET